MKNVLRNFWNQDTDTVIYTLLCIFTLPAIAIGLWYWWFTQTKMPAGMERCVLQLTLGAYCPGCGGTRALMKLFQGDILGAIYYHPAAVYGVVLYLVYFVSQTLMRLSKGKIWGMKLRPMYLYVMLALILLNWMVRNVLLFGLGIHTL